MEQFAIVKNQEVVRFLQAGVAFELDGVQYPSNWLNFATLEEKESRGIYEVIGGAEPDQRFYWQGSRQDVVDEENKKVTVSWPALPKDLDQLKQEWLRNVKTAAASLLAPTDWYLVRKLETEQAIPQPVQDHRLAVRTASNQYEQAIQAATSVEDIISVSQTISWPVRSDQT